MNILLILISIVFTFFLPMISVFINFANYIIFKKNRKIYALLTAISLGLIAYTWEPAVSYDLYRWQQEIRLFSYSNFSSVIQRISTDLEPLNYIIKFFISKTGNFDLVQLVISTVGYFEILWIIADYAKNKKINILNFTVGVVFILSSLKYVDFISGLWFNFAIINFALGLYLNYTKQTKKTHWIFYIIAIATHISTIYILLLLIISKMIEIKNYKKAVFFTFLISLWLGVILNYLDSHLNIFLINYISKLYITYFINGSQFNYLHSGANLIYAIIRLAIIIIVLYSEKGELKNKNSKLIAIIALTCSSTIAILFHAKVYIRFIFFIQLMTLPMFFDFLSRKVTYMKTIVISCIAIFSFFLFKIQYNQMKSAKLLECINYNLLNPIYKLENGYSE